MQGSAAPGLSVRGTRFKRFAAPGLRGSAAGKHAEHQLHFELVALVKL